MLTFDEYLKGLTEALAGIDRNAFDAAVAVIRRVHDADKIVYVCGNGGSAATASHMINDLVKAPAEAAGCRPIRAVGLADCVPLMTAFANDSDYALMFSRQIEAMGREGDLLIAVSGSGNSANVVEAARVAKARGMTIVAMTGFDGGKLADVADVHINCPSSCFGHIEDAHLVIEHAMVEALKEAFGGHSAARAGE